MNLTEELFERAIQPQGDENGMFPWHYAAFFGCLMTLKCYKEKGFDISSQTNSYWDILLIAASQNQSEIIEWILQENIVSVDDTSDAFNRTALFLAIQYITSRSSLHPPKVRSWCHSAHQNQDDLFGVIFTLHARYYTTPSRRVSRMRKWSYYKRFSINLLIFYLISRLVHVLKRVNTIVLHHI